MNDNNQNLNNSQPVNDGSVGINQSAYTPQVPINNETYNQIPNNNGMVQTGNVNPNVYNPQYYSVLKLWDVYNNFSYSDIMKLK